MITQDHLILTLLVGLGFLLAACIWTVASIPLAILVARVMHDRREADAQMAADFGEPSRAQVEAAMTETPIFDATAAHIAARAADGIDDEWRRICEATR